MFYVGMTFDQDLSGYSAGILVQARRKCHSGTHCPTARASSWDERPGGYTPEEDQQPVG
jgi:hypothetical protein